MVQKYLSKRGGRFYCVFIDFTKSLDTVDRYKLLTSLNKMTLGMREGVGVGGSTYL